MSNNLPEWTAQAFVAAGAVFLLISAYWMGVYVPNAKELSDDFESEISFDGDMTLLNQGKFATLQGNYDPANGLDTFYAKDGTNAVIVAKADSSGSNDEQTLYNFNASAYADQERTNRILTFSDTDNYVDRTTYQTKSASDEGAEFSQTAWNPNNLPKAEDTMLPNPFVSTHMNTYKYEGEETVDGIDCYKYTVDEDAFPYSSDSILALKATFDGLLPEGVVGQSAGEMLYKETIWVSKDTGQVADRFLDVTVNFAPDARLAGNFIAQEDYSSAIQYSGTLDGQNVTADRNTDAVSSTMSGTDNATGAARTYIDVRGTLTVNYPDNSTEEKVNSTFRIDTHNQQAQIPLGNDTYQSVGSTFFTVGATCATNDTHLYGNLFLTTHVNNYTCVESTQLPGYTIPLVGLMGETTAYHYQSVENGVDYGLNVDDNGTPVLSSLPVFDPSEGYCMNPAACPDRQWASLIAFALTQTALGENALQIPIRSDSTMTLPRFTTDMSLVENGDAVLGGSYHPLVQTSFTAIDEYATGLGLDVSYNTMPFVVNHTASEGLQLPVPGDAACYISGVCVMGTNFTHPLVAGMMAQVMIGLGTEPANAAAAYGAVPWVKNGSMTLPVPGNAELWSAGLAKFGADFHPMVQANIASVSALGVNPSTTPWMIANDQIMLPVLNGTGEMTYGYLVGFEGCPAMCYNVTLDPTTAATAGILGNQSVIGDPTSWTYNPWCTIDKSDVPTGVCVFGAGVVAALTDSVMTAESEMPTFTPAQLPELDVDTPLPVIAPQTVALVMDYEENVWVDPVTGVVLDQVFNITVSANFPWGKGPAVQTVNVAYTDEQKLASSVSRWNTEFGYTYLPGSPLRANNSDFTIMTLTGGYSSSEKNDAINTIEDTTSALKTGEQTVPTLLIGLAMVSLAGGFYVYYQNNQGGDFGGGGMDDHAGEESAPSMATTSDEEDSSEAEASDDDSDGDSSGDDSESEEE